MAKRQGRLQSLFVFGIMLTVIQQMPVIRDVAYSEIRLVLYVIFGLIALLSLRRSFSTSLPTLVKVFLGIIIILTAEMLLFQLLHWRSTLSSITELLIPFGILIGAYYLDFDRFSVERIMMAYSTLAVLMGVLLVLYYGGGFILREQYIGGTSKNQTGPILAIASVILFDKLFNYDRNKTRVSIRLIYIVGPLIGGVAALVVLRNRAGLVAVLVVFTLITLNKLRKSFTLLVLIVMLIISILLLVLFLAGYLDPIVGIVYDAFTMNYDITDLDSLSAGRIRTYIEALKFVSLYPFFGELSSAEAFFGTPHNYVLNKWVSFGIVGSLPFIVLYGYLISFALRMLFYKQRDDFEDTALWLLLLGLIISMFEYTYPYGPGVSQVMVWFMLGRFIRNKKGADR